MTARENIIGRRVPVLLPVALDQTYDYLVPADIDAAPGDFVLVPFGRQNRVGVVWEARAEEPGRALDPAKLKTVTSRLDVPTLPEISRRFAEWVARYTLAPLGMVVRMMMSAPTVFDPPNRHFGVRCVPGAPQPQRMTPARARALAIAEDGQTRTKSALAVAAGCTTSVIDGLIASGQLAAVVLAEKGASYPNPAYAAPRLSPDQERAAHALRSALDADVFSVTLLDGVTGSGKTEVYFEAVARALERDRQVLILLPEIALTSQFLGRFQARFGCLPIEWHSALADGERGWAWRKIASGEARVVAGARSALFLPFPNLGLIVVDEEHDGGFKQDDRVHYQGRDMAVVRAHLGGFPAILASATPSIESHVNAETGRYRHAVLPSRFSGTNLPDVTTIDLRREAPEKGRWLAPKLVEAVTETLAAGRQALLFLNRRGYAPLTLCRACGHRLECPQCTAWLVEHRFKKHLTCHHCGFALPPPEKCAKCHEPGMMVPCGPGVERVAEEVAERFPGARRTILSSDLVSTLAEMRKVIHAIETGQTDIVIGTQMVAKGHHFPGLALVGVVDGDLGLAHGADPRASERTFQLLHQVTGRAGRAVQGGRGFVQTYTPEHPVMQAIVSGNRDAFVAQEIAIRRAGGLPPFGRLAALIVSAREKGAAERYAREIARRAPAADHVEVLGPAEAPMALVRGRQRWRLLVKTPRDVNVQGYLRAWLALIPPTKGDLKLTVDIDPYGFL